jgi:exonuclease VII small subunit
MKNKYEITKQIQNLKLEDLIDLLHDLDSKLNSDDVCLEESMKIFDFAKKIQNLALSKLKEIEFQFEQILIDEKNKKEKSQET